MLESLNARVHYTSNQLPVHVQEDYKFPHVLRLELLFQSENSLLDEKIEISCGNYSDAYLKMQ